jgi:hypothetical protein
MISTKEKVVTNLSDLTETQLRQVAEYLEFLKFRELRRNGSQPNHAGLETLYAEFADEDRELAEVGLADYSTNLALDDAAQ